VAVIIVLCVAVAGYRRRRLYAADYRIDIPQCKNDNDRRNVVYNTAFADLPRSVNNRADRVNDT